MTDARSIARLGLGGLAFAEVAATWRRWERRRALFLIAAEHARSAGRPLLVVLPPRESELTRALQAYEFGAHHDDVLRPGASIRVDKLARGTNRATDSAIVYVACALEYVEDLGGAMAEILRVAGSIERIYAVTVQPWTITAALHPAAHWAGISDAHVVSMGPVTGLHRAFAAGTLVTLALLSLGARVHPVKGLPVPKK